MREPDPVTVELDHFALDRPGERRGSVGSFGERRLDESERRLRQRRGGQKRLPCPRGKPRQPLANELP